MAGVTTCDWHETNMQVMKAAFSIFSLSSYCKAREGLYKKDINLARSQIKVVKRFIFLSFIDKFDTYEYRITSII